MVGVGPAEMTLVIAILMGGFIGFPLSVPPLPPDPVVQRALPDDCLFAIHYNGHAQPDAKSKNATEQLLADEEVQQFITQVSDQVLKVIRSRAADDPTTAGLAEELPGVLHTLATRPLALYVGKVAMTAEVPDIRAGLVVNAGDAATTLATSLKKIEDLLREGPMPQLKTQSIEIGGVKLTELPWPPQAPPGLPQIVWGFKQQMFILAVGKDSAKDLLARMADKNRKLPAWYTGIQKRLPVERVSSTSYINVAGILKAAEPAMTDPKTKPILAALGVDKVRALGSVGGMTSKGMSSSSWLAIDGEPTGIFALAATKGITSADLSIIPQEVVMTQVLKLDLANAYTCIMKGVGSVEPQARQAAEAQLKQLEGSVGISLENDLLKPLGDTWSVFSTPGSGVGIPTGLAITVSLRDREKFAATHEKLLAIASGALAQASEGKFSIKTSEYKGTRLYTLQGAGSAAVPVSPTWCLSKDRLLITLFPQMIKTLLARTPQDKSVADVAEVQSMLSGDPPASLGYQDTPAMVNSTYAMYQVFAPMLQGQLAGQGLDIELPTLPSQKSLTPHILPQVSAMRRAKGGLLFGKTYSMPVAAGVDPTTVGIGVALLLPAVQAAREAARRNQATNNLKQILLAMHNHHDVYKGFPAPAITDKAGKPLLSWRVKILPFIEETALYEKFHLDEPWDSEHNKQLIPQMPAVYLNPSRIYKGDGTTTYEFPTGTAGLFKDVAKAVQISEITDGTSNTIAVVEVDEDHAVPWTKPADLKIDPKKPLEGLKGARVGGFLAAFADGSVRMISDDIDKTVLPALFTPTGGEAVTAP